MKGKVVIDSKNFWHRGRGPMNHQYRDNFARHAGQLSSLQSRRIVGFAKQDLPALGS